MKVFDDYPNEMKTIILNSIISMKWHILNHSSKEIFIIGSL